MFNKSIGIIGGMGPAASAELHTRLIRLAQKEYGAVQDADFPKIILVNASTRTFNHQGFQQSTKTHQLVLAQVSRAIKTLETAHADFVITACNTLHYYHDTLQNTTPMPMLNIVEETVIESKLSGAKIVGVVASASSAKMGIYQKMLHMHGLKHVSPTEREQVVIDKVILHAMAGDTTTSDVNSMQSICNKLQKRGADAIILGCTELSLLAKDVENGPKILDSLDVITKAALAMAKG